MAEGFFVDGEVFQDVYDRVKFNIRNLDGTNDVKLGYISIDALERLNNGSFEDAVVVFNEYRHKIESRAGAHWNANPFNEVIMLGKGDF